MDANNGNETDGNLSPIPVMGERVAILDAGAQYGKVSLKCNYFYSVGCILVFSLTFVNR